MMERAGTEFPQACNSGPVYCKPKVFLEVVADDDVVDVVIVVVWKCWE